MKEIIVHQVYGLFEDGTEWTDNELFKESVMRWIYIITQNNNNPNRKYDYKYKLWDKNKCDELLYITLLLDATEKCR